MSSPLIYIKDDASDCYYVCSENKWKSCDSSNGFYANNFILNKIKNNNLTNGTTYKSTIFINDSELSSLYWHGSANIKFVDDKTNMHVYHQFAKIHCEYFLLLLKNENKTI